VQGEEVVQGHRVDGGVHLARREQGLGAGGEAQAPAVLGPVEGLDAEAVPGEEEHPLAASQTAKANMP
jgi:hypothetical protein